MDAVMAIGSAEFNKVDFNDDLTSYGSYTALSKQPAYDEYEGLYPLADLDELGIAFDNEYPPEDFDTDWFIGYECE